MRKASPLHTASKNTRNSHSAYRYIGIENRFAHTFRNSYFRYKREKVILSSCRRLRPSEARVKRPHEDKITFSLAYRTQSFHTTCAKLDLAHAVLSERAQSDTLRTECEKIVYATCALRYLLPTLVFLGTLVCSVLFKAFHYISLRISYETIDDRDN